MKLSTIYLWFCFALSPFAARAMIQHRDVLHQLQRYTIPIMAAAPVPVVLQNEDFILLTRNGAESVRKRSIDSNSSDAGPSLRSPRLATQALEFMSLSFPM
ncbi:MAG: hypothetical protein JO136_19770 [Hyphomicrobiales bacterium]|nr:hypothetical protein [Hyphomicrobiales bacterium]MBV9910080.1 hypothetical protein [Hyphomicrobiales bacterium]